MKKKKQYFFYRSYLDDGERILQVAHRHILILKLASAKTVFLGILVPLLGYLLFPQILLVFVVWWFVGAIGLLYHFIDWYFDVWLLTNYGVIDIERNGLLDVTSTRIEYHMIEGISFTIRGWLPTIFNYGDITIDKLGAKTSVVLKDSTKPKRLERQVLKYQEKFVYEKSVRDHHQLKDMLSEMIAYHVNTDKVQPSKSDKDE
ncbi:hypothetical protein HN709_02530 [Candidatus Peregrinibacteria bacterium]|nr:hypothetical protein [Candidatus Peregrinibacteria bacterium]MBT7736539.1 hypothetical protein [Candidatus Peregrinibacteria bacterium]